MWLGLCECISLNLIKISRLIFCESKLNILSVSLCTLKIIIHNIFTEINIFQTRSKICFFKRYIAGFWVNTIQIKTLSNPWMNWGCVINNRWSGQPNFANAKDQRAIENCSKNISVYSFFAKSNLYRPKYPSARREPKNESKQTSTDCAVPIVIVSLNEIFRIKYHEI